jgi:hypothetical protein
MTANSDQAHDERTIADLERQLRGAEMGLARLEEQFPAGREPNERARQAKRDALSDLERLRTNLERARAQFALNARQAERDEARRTVDANERMAKASAEAARWAKWAAFGTAFAALAALASTAQVAFQTRADEQRRHPHIGIRLVTKDAYVAAVAGGMAGATARLMVTQDAIAQPQSGKPAATPPSAAAAPPLAAPEPTSPSPPDKDVYHLLVRNLSERPTALVDVALRRADGAGISIRSREYVKRIGLPLVLSPWSVVAVQVQIDFPEVRDAQVLVLRDMDDQEIRVPLKDDSAWQRWMTTAEPGQVVRK